MKTIVRNYNFWSFLESTTHNIHEGEKSILKKVHQETNLFLPSVSLALTQNDTINQTNFYLAQLTDKNVNEITRHEGEELLFFSMEETASLSLAPSSKKLFLQCNQLIRDTFDPPRNFNEMILNN